MINSYLLSCFCLNRLFRLSRKQFRIRKENCTITTSTDMLIQLLNWLQGQTITNNRVCSSSIKEMYLIMANSRARHSIENGTNTRECIFQNSTRNRWRSMGQKYKDTLLVNIEIYCDRSWEVHVLETNWRW